MKSAEDPTRWRDLPEAGTDAALMLRAARRPRAPGADDLARLGGVVADLPRRSLATSLRNARLFAATAAAVTLLALGGGVWAWRGRSEAAPSPAAVATAPAATVARPAVAELPRIAPAPVARAVAHPAPRPTRRPPAVTVPEADPLTREIALIDDARRDVAVAPAQALRAANAHLRAFPDGQLGAEREFLAVEALRRLGRLDEARARAAALASRYPASSYASRAARLLQP